MRKIKRKWRRFSLYKKSMIIMLSILIIFGCVFLGYVYKSMILYERNLIDNYIVYITENGTLLKDINEDDIKISAYENSNINIKDSLNKFYKSNNLKIKKNVKESTNDIYVYDLYNENKLISKVSLKCKNKYKRMAILTIYEWEILDYQNYLDNGLYNYEITIPSNYKLYINDKLANEEDKVKEEEIKGLEKLTNYVEISKRQVYTINNLFTKPSIKILDENDKEVEYKLEDNKINIDNNFKEINEYEDAKNYIKDDFDILKFAETYSLFLSDDLQGTNHGFEVIKPYLINDSYMYNMAYKWSRSIDITFVSNHKLKSPTFTNESLSKFIIYNENAFSVEVYLDKNMIVSGKDLVDTMHDRLYFIYYNGGYKLVDMASVTER